MFNLNDLPVELFAVALLFLIPLGIYEYIRFHKQNPGNPLNKMTLFSLLLLVIVFSKNFVYSITDDTNIIKTVDIINIIYLTLFAIAFAITWTLAYKRGYIDKEALNRRKPLFKTCGIVIVICIIILAIILGLDKLDELNLLP